MEKPAYPWTEQILKLLEDAGDLSDSASSLLAAALPQLESPSALRTGDAKGGASLITLAEGRLEDASSDLTSCASSMEAAELIDRRRGPATRLPQPSQAALQASMNLLLGHPGVPGVDGCIEAERVAAVCAIEAALGAVGGGGG